MEFNVSGPLLIGSSESEERRRPILAIEAILGIIISDVKALYIQTISQLQQINRINFWSGK
jgi:hypothetical protein